MAAVKDQNATAQKWARVTQQRTGDYQTGVQNPRVSWSQATQAGADNYNAGVQAAIAAKSFQKGVAAAGDDAWRRGATEKGPARFAEGVAIAEPAYSAAIGPYLQTIASTQLPPRYPKGDPRNLERVKVLAMALRKKKTGGA